MFVMNGMGVIFMVYAPMGELVDPTDLSSVAVMVCEFDSRSEYMELLIPVKS